MTMAVGGQTEPFSSETILDRCRRLQELVIEIQNAALKHVARSAILGHAKRIGLVDGSALVGNSESEGVLVCDLALYSVGAGGTRAIDRYSRARSSIGGPDEVLVLRALCDARFSLFRIVGKQPPVGVRLEDVVRGGEFWLPDENLEQGLQAGDFLAARVAAIEDFSVLCGAIVPFDDEMAAEMEFSLVSAEDQTALIRRADKGKLAEQIYRIAVKRELMNRVEYV
jgi:hypothetical protein